MKLLHHTPQRINSRDQYFICAGNPSGDGGGVIASRNSFDEALALKLEAIKQGYVKVQILTWKELMEED